MRKHRSGFGLPYDTHRARFSELVAQGFRSADMANQLLEDGECKAAFDQLLTVRDRLSRAQMHLVSAVEPEQFSPTSAALSISGGRLGDLNMKLFSIAERFRAKCMCSGRRR